MPQSIKLSAPDDIQKKEKFRQWLNQQKGNFAGYETFLLREKLCEVVKSFGEDNIYRISESPTVDSIKKVYIKKYNDENINSSSGGPSAALGKYSEYLKEVQGNTNPTSTGGNNSTSKVHGRNIIFYGAPGTGKSHTVDNIIKGIKEKGQEDYGLGPGIDFRTTFHPDTDYATFVGCYKPSMKNNRIEYHFTMQVFLKAYKCAWEDLNKQVYLVIEEINRGNCAQIFGDIFQLLDREPQTDGHSRYLIIPDDDIKSELFDSKFKDKYITNLGIEYEKEKNPEIAKKIEDGVLALPHNLTILATMNTSDQSLFPMDSAFKRRWEWKYIKIDYENKRIQDWIIKIGDKEFKWKSALKGINDYIRERKNSTDKQMGEFFIMPKDNDIITFEEFRDKVLFYLFNDVFKGDRSFFANDNNRRFFDDFFSDGLGEKEVCDWLKEMRIESQESDVANAEDANKNNQEGIESIKNDEGTEETNN